MIGVCTKLTRALACSALAKMNQVEDVATVFVLAFLLYRVATYNKVITNLVRGRRYN